MTPTVPETPVVKSSAPVTGGKHLVDYVFMRPPSGGPAEKIVLDPNDENQVGRLMFQDWRQVDESEVTQQAAPAKKAE